MRRRVNKVKKKTDEGRIDHRFGEEQGHPASGWPLKCLKSIQQESYRVSVALLLLRMVHWGYGVWLKYTHRPLTRN